MVGAAAAGAAGASVVNHELDAAEWAEALGDKLQAGGSESRERLWDAIIQDQDHFMRFSHSIFIRAVNALFEEGRIGFEDMRRTGRVNDHAKLYVKKKVYRLNLTTLNDRLSLFGDPCQEQMGMLGVGPGAGLVKCAVWPAES
jgi:hypothetical protein